jgi:uncharacterized membrane protein required for colicin V production
MKIAKCRVKKNSNSHALFYTLGGVAAFLLAYGFYKGLPDLIRYIKIRQM